MDTTFVVFIIALFAAIMLLVWGMYLAWQAHRSPEATLIARRLHGAIGDEARPSEVTIVKERRLSDHEGLDRLLRRVRVTHMLERMLVQAGARYRVASLLARCAGGFVLAFVLGAWLRLPSIALLPLALAVATLPLLRLVRARNARLARFERQLPDALDMMGRSMRAGHAFPTALKLVADEVAAPLGVEFKAALDEVNFGVALGDALHNLAQRVPSMDLQYFVVAVLIQRESGGNLTELLASISAIIRDRQKLAGQVRVLSAEGRMSAWVLFLLPFGAGGMMYMANPDAMLVLVNDPLGLRLLGTALLMMLTGVLAIRKIVRIRM